MPKDLRRARELFMHAVGKLPPERWDSYVSEACGGDTELAQQVKHFLQVHVEAGTFLERPAPAPGATRDFVAEPTCESHSCSAGTVIGSYKLLEPIGEGGFGVVYAAEQTQPVRRRVALKILKPGMDTRQVIARFEAERQALALMDHPNIARVFDGGATPSGRPYFVMELVKGVPITEFCDQNQLSPRQRLELFIPVCQAVQHAHQKGIVHRDLKPSNVLVSRHDTTPVVKVIDFGIAKALGQELTEKTVFTGIAQLIGTPVYMSPEQAGMSDLDVDTRSDIYSAGVLLYELLTGTTPFDSKRFQKAGYEEMRRIIREEEPPVPSRRLSDSTDSLPSISAQRRMEPARLTKLVRGELDWIVMKALEKDRGRRYESASAFAADIERYLKDEPVLAGPPGAGYRLKKFLRRNRGSVLAASFLLLALFAGVIGTSLGLLQAQRAEREAAQRAEGERRAKETAKQRLAQIEKANEILGSVFKDLDPETVENQGKPLRVLLGERLEQASAQLEGESIGDPLAVAHMQVILGQCQLGLGYAEKGIALLSKARATFATLSGPDDPDTLASMNAIARGYYDVGRPDLSVPLFKETFERRKATLGPNHPDTLQSMNDLASGYRAVNQLDVAVPLVKEALERRKETLGSDNLDTLESMNFLALIYQDMDERELALPMFKAVLDGRRRKLSAEHADVLQSMNNLALAYRAAGQFDLAVPLIEETLKLVKDKLGDNHPYTLKTANNLALTYQDAGLLDLALPLYEETLKRKKKKFPPDHPDVLQSMKSLAAGYQASGKLEQALRLYEETLEGIRRKFAVDDVRTITTMTEFGKTYLQAGKPEKAEPIFRECLAVLEKTQPDNWRTFDTRSLLGAALLGQKKYAAAEPLLLAGYQGMKEREAKVPPLQRRRLIEDPERLLRLYQAMGNQDKANEWRKNLAEAKAAAKADGK
jgi:serine/threonine protein kinase